MTLLLIVGVVGLLIGLNALYVAAEFAAVSARRTRVQHLAEDGSRLARQLLPYLNDRSKLDRYIAACQIGITLSSLVVGFYGQSQLAPHLGFGMSLAVATLIALILLTSLQVVFGELVPKSLAMRYPERVALLTVTPLLWSLFILRPLIALLNGSALALLRLLGLKPSNKTYVHSPEELEFIFRESQHGGYIDVEEREMLENVLQLEARLARQVMIPRNRMVAVSSERKAGELLQELVQTPHMRFPVYEGDIDHIVGILNLKDLFLLAQQDPESGIESILREPLLAPETNTASELWEMMQQRGSPVAVLFDEYGGTAGIVTLEDIIEEIIGEVQDEFDDEDQRIYQEGKTLHVRGDVLVSAINRKFLLDLPQDSADTIGGLLMETLERVPKVGERARVDGLELCAERVEDNAVTLVSFELPDTSAEETDAP